MITQSAATTSVRKNEEGTLTRRAGLTFTSSMLQQGAEFIVSFIALPIVVSGLGAPLYGAWTMIQQTAGYLAQSDLRAMGTLKFSLGVRQHLDDIHEKRRLVGSSILVWAGTLPILLLLGAAVVWAAPAIIRVDPANSSVVRAAMAIAIIGVALDRVLSIPANVLRGTNLDYRAMGLNAATIILGGILGIAAIRLGFGLAGVAAATVVGVILAGGARLIVARRAIPWFGAALPKRSDFFAFSKLSGWLFMSGIAGLLMNSSDLILVGILLGPSAAAIYAMTGAVLRFAVGPLRKLFNSGGPGIAELCGRRDWSRVATARTELHLAGLIVIAVVGVGVIALNESFLRLWVGDGFYGGSGVNVILVLVAVVATFLRVDGMIADSMLEFRPKALITMVSGVLILGVGGWLMRSWGLMGMAFGALLGNLVLMISVQYLVSRHGRINIRRYLEAIFRPVGVAAVLLWGSYVLSQSLNPQTWISFFASAAAIGLLAAMLMLALGVPSQARTSLTKRVLAAVQSGRQQVEGEA